MAAQYGRPLCFAAVDSFFFSSLILSGHRLDVYHRPTSTHNVALVRIQNAQVLNRLRGGKYTKPAVKLLQTIFFKILTGVRVHVGPPIMPPPSAHVCNSDT